MVAWASYKATFRGNGLLQFAASPSAGSIYNKQFISFGFGSNLTANGQCRLPISSSFNGLSSVVEVDITLCENAPCQANPCPGILAPEVAGCVDFSVQYSVA